MASIEYSAWSLSNVLRGSIRDNRCSYFAIIALCYAKRAMLKSDEPCAADKASLYKITDEVNKTDDTGFISHFISDVFNSERYFNGDEVAIHRTLGYLPNDVEGLEGIILDVKIEEDFLSQFVADYSITPSSISELAIRMLDIKDEDSFADFGTGTGSFLVKASKQANCKLIYGCDIDSTLTAVAMIRVKVIGSKVVVKQADMFSVDEKFDKCFSNYPFAVCKYGLKEEVLQRLAWQGLSDLPNFSSSDWLFNLQLLARLNDGGKAVIIMTRGSSVNGADEKIRKYFTASGWIEAVVALPAGMLPYTSAPATMLVLSHGNSEVRLVDATTICQKGRRQTTFSDSDIESIISLLSKDKKGYSRRLTYDELAREGFSLNPERYLGEKIVVENGVPIKDLSIAITRGSGWSKAKLEQLNSKVPTRFRYLMLQHIVDGELERDLPYLTEIEESQKKYCVKDGDVLLSKIGPNFKVAVAEVSDNETVLATGNLYIIRVDTSKIDPRYLKLYLESEQGIAQLRRECVGNVMPNVPMSAFSKICVPMVSLEEQQKILEKYEALRQEISMHKIAIERARSKMANLICAE